MEAGIDRHCVGDKFPSPVTSACDPRLDRLVDRLPRRLRSIVRWLRRPSSLWI